METKKAATVEVYSEPIGLRVTADMSAAIERAWRASQARTRNHWIREVLAKALKVSVERMKGGAA